MKLPKLLTSGFFFALAFAGFGIPVWNSASVLDSRMSTLDESKFDDTLEEGVQIETAADPAGQNFTASQEIRFPIFVYHGVRSAGDFEKPLVRHYNISPENLNRQLAFLKYNGYTTISFKILLDFFASGKLLPPKPVILSFDDGWQDQYTAAFPLLQKYGFTATFFIFTGAIGKPHFLTEEEIIAMSEAGMEVGAHTVTHPYLTKIPKERAETEISESKKKLELITGKAVRVFAYPFGQTNSFLEQTVHDLGFNGARGTFYGTKNNFYDSFNLKSVEATNDFKKFESVLEN